MAKAGDKTLGNTPIDAKVPTGRTASYAIHAGNDDGLFQIDSSTGEITAAMDFANPLQTTYYIQIKVFDSVEPQLYDLATVSISLTRIGSVTGTERHGTTDLPANITVTGITSNVLYVCPGNDVNLTVAAAPGAQLPPGNAVLFRADGPGATPTTQNLATTDVITPASGTTETMIRVGIDFNGDGTLQNEEETHAFLIRVIDLSSTKIEAARIAPVSFAESYFEINSGEYVDSGAASAALGNSVFSIRLEGGVQGTPSMIRPRVYYGSSPQSVHPVFATTFNWTPSGTSDSARIEFFADANNSGTYDAGEQIVKSNEFKVVNWANHTLTFEFSNLIPASRIPDTAAARLAHAQNYIDTEAVALIVKNTQEDYRAPVWFTMQPYLTGTFIVNPTTRPDQMAQYSSSLHTSQPHDLTFTFNLTWAFTLAGWKQVTGVQDSNGMVVAFDSGSTEPGTLIHEIGHYYGIFFHSSGPDDVMLAGSDDLSGKRNILLKSHGTKFYNGK